jgi:hypothetical protein
VFYNAFVQRPSLEPPSADPLWELEHCVLQCFCVAPEFGATICRPSLEAGTLCFTMLLCSARVWIHHLHTLSGSWNTVFYNAFV